MKRLIPRFNQAQFEAMATIKDASGNPVLDAGYALKACTNDGATMENVWWSRGLGLAVVEQAKIVDHQWKVIAELGYKTQLGQLSIIADLDSDQMKAIGDQVDWMLTADMFGSNYIGGWAKSVEFDQFLGWLVLEKDADRIDPREDVVIQRWRAEESLLGEGYYRLNRETARRAIELGIIKHGIDFIEVADADMIDDVLQVAILGEKIYC